MKAFAPTEQELLVRLKWFVQLRWLFLLGLATALFFAVKVFGLGMNLTPILIVVIAVVIYNFVFYFLHRSRNRHPEREVTLRGLRIEANLQIGLDLLSLIFLVHFTGGIENPFIFFFVFHMLLGSILLAGRDIWFHAIFTITILFILLGLSYFNILSHHQIEGFASEELWSNVPYLWAGILSFGTTILMAVYMTNSIARSLRHREGELFFTKNQLENQSKKLEQANMELIRQQNLLVQSEKLASLGKLSAGIAHELNNPLTGILSFSHFIKEECTEQSRLQHDIDIVIRETNRCKVIIKGLLDFARQSKPEKKSGDIIQLLNKVISLVENHKDFKNIEIVKHFPEELMEIMYDKDQIQQVFMNLMVNAQEAMPDGGALHVSVRISMDMEYVVIRFRDSGTGITEENMKKIFDPFFTTKETGTGLGLSIILGIIENHEGKLEADSELGKGATFTVKLPIT